jgi:transcriptional regulator with XRE-family HTH domain
MEGRDDLAEFLRQRRAAVDPAAVGLPAGPRRRATGLRREEVALLAGISVTWYTWLEQGRPINASRSVLDALARTLLLDDAQHAHLLALAAPRDATDAIDAVADEPPPDALLRALRALDPSPAYLLGPRWEYLAWNDAQGRLYPPAARLAGPDRNLIWIVFTEPDARRLILDWDHEARFMLSQFRADTTAIRSDAGVVDLLDRLHEASAEFAAWWPEHDVSGFHTRLRRYRHPLAGDLVFEYQQLTPVEWPQFRLVGQLPVPGDDSTDRLAGVTVDPSTDDPRTFDEVPSNEGRSNGK